MLLQQTLLCWWIFVYVLGYGACCDLVCGAIANGSDIGKAICLPSCETVIVKEPGENFCPALCSKLSYNGSVCEGACKAAYEFSFFCNIGKETVCLIEQYLRFIGTTEYLPNLTNYSAFAFL